ncbi:G patch domain-containing protein 1 homolog [Haematobia irritans]|uniref:G patch domain-containing protein 1 homolog n=1 Tax=Haematobia irritans TaxID=7368 RepID=UPI003F503107
MNTEKGLHQYGTPLPMLDMDEVVPSKKPVYAQDQIATDDQGRRRFHGAFTGGFSAGYWNTVGSKEGWTPQSFKSSRTEKAASRATQRPEDFMDDEDLGEFGINPKGLQIHEDFTGAETSSEHRKRKFLQADLKPIPGEPVLQQLLKPVKDKIAVRILKSWGWRPGQGVGPRQTRKEKKMAKERNKRELYLMEKYGCDLPSSSKSLDTEEEDEDSDEDSENEVTFAPEDFEAIPYTRKTDHYGLGYTPLSRQSVLGGISQTSSLQSSEGHINLFKPLEAIGKNNQKISFSGQAFGVGALEDDDDDDVYANDDLSRYDFSLEDRKKKKKNKKSLGRDELVFEDFVLDLNAEKPLQFTVEVPFGWQPRNWYQKRSRFEPLDPRAQRNLERKFAKPHDDGNEGEMTRQKRAELLGEEVSTPVGDTSAKFVSPTVLKPSVEELQKQHKDRQERTKSLMEKISAKSSSFTRGGIITLEGEEKPSANLTLEEISTSFKPFVNDEAKQKRYEKFLAANLSNDKEIDEFLHSIQPIELSLWDRQMERKEFVQAKKLYRPLKGIMSDRFVTESEVKAEQQVAEITKDPTKAISVERTKTMWKPHSLLCKRFNIAEPFGGHMEDESKRKSKQKSNKMSVFDYLETSINKKEDFQTPVIIPKHIERPQELITQKPEEAAKDKPTQEDPKSLEWQEVLEGKTKLGQEKSSFVFKAKTELERKVVETLDKPIAEKKELFKSIFSDSESDNDDDNDSQVGEKTKDVDSNMAAALSKPLNAAAANLLRNNSPPRGIFKALFNLPESSNTMEKQQISETPKDASEKEILENAKETSRNDIGKLPTNAPSQAVTSQDSQRILFQPKSSRESKEIDSSLKSDEQNLYGPALPQAAVKYVANKNLANNSSNSIDDKLLKLYNKHKTSGQITEVWVEKGTVNSSSDSETDSSDTSSSSDNVAKHKKRSKKKSKQKKSSSSGSAHKHKKHKDHKTNKKSKKSEKKKKKHKQK